MPLILCHRCKHLGCRLPITIQEQEVGNSCKEGQKYIRKQYVLTANTNTIFKGGEINLTEASCCFLFRIYQGRYTHHSPRTLLYNLRTFLTYWIILSVQTTSKIPYSGKFKCKNSSKKSSQFSAAKFNFTPHLVSAICSVLSHKYLDILLVLGILAMNFLPKNYT